MASILPGYEYDIFISYRQKDNKHDGWVTKFVDNLKGELEATFKEDISIYFDENPHERLQETHNVDKSLEGKLKCLIFIPILSQTYCDPNSYAWQYEFLAFSNLAREDHLGRDIRLRSGNYASRILPMRIHDLEPEDVKIFEKETGSVLRAMDFVFKTASGVSRPLKANEDHPHDNLNKTFYSDQINKVGHAIKEIIQGMKGETIPVEKEKTLQGKKLEEVIKEGNTEIEKRPIKLSSIKLLSGVLITAAMVIAAIFAYPIIFKEDTLEKLRSSGERISVAVMPFQNMTNDTTKNFLQEMIQNNLITSLSNNPEELKVRQIESVTGLLQSKGIGNYASITPSIARKISQKLDVDVFIKGSIQQVGSKLRVNAKLIDTKTEEVIKSFEIDRTYKEDIIFDIIDSLRKKVSDFLIISKLKEEVSHETQKIISTSYPEAYRLFIRGSKAFNKGDNITARNLFLNSIAIDSNFVVSIIYLSVTYEQQGLIEQAKKWCISAYKKRDLMSLRQKYYSNWLHARFFETPNEEIKFLRQLLEIDDKLPFAYYEIGNGYNDYYQYNKAIPEYERALEIFNSWDLKPSWIFNYTELGLAYHKTHLYGKEMKLYNKAKEDFPDNPILIYRQAVLALCEGRIKDANAYIEKYESILKENSASEAGITTDLASVYSEAGILDKAEEYFRQAIKLEPESPDRLSNLANFLIEKDRNVNEGMELINKVLAITSDNYNYLRTKGWGLYKQGKYKEALDILQKSWDLRREKAVYDHESFLHLEAAKKAVANLK